MNSNPNDLVAQAKSGSREALGALYTKYHQSIYRYLYYRTSDPQTAEDLTADVFLKMVQALPAYRPGAIPFQAWLFQIARNTAIDHYRRVNAHPVETIQESYKADDKVEQDLDKRITNDALSRALAALDDLQRDVILLRFIEGMHVLQVAQTLHKTEDAIKAIQHRGLVSLRSKFDSQE